MHQEEVRYGAVEEGREVVVEVHQEDEGALVTAEVEGEVEVEGEASVPGEVAEEVDAAQTPTSRDLELFEGEVETFYALGLEYNPRNSLKRPYMTQYFECLRQLLLNPPKQRALQVALRHRPILFLVVNSSTPYHGLFV